MKTKQKQNKLVWALSIVLVALLAFTSVITFAYFTDSKTSASQNMTFDTLVLTINNDNWVMAGSEQEQLTNIVPGCTINLAGSVDLEGAASYLKVDFSVEGTPAEGKVLDAIAINAIKTALGNALVTEGQTWVQGTDNAWYCITSVEAGEAVIDFAGNTVTIPLATTGNVWQGATIEIGYSVSAIQSANVELAGADNNAKAASLKTLMGSLNMETGLATA